MAKEPWIILLVGHPKTGKTVSACTFPKPILLLDFDDGSKSIKQLPEIVTEQEQITVEKFKHNRRLTLNFSSSKKGTSAPAHTLGAAAHIMKMNKIIRELKEGDYKTIIIDSMTSMYRIWKQNILVTNKQPSLQQQDYETLAVVFFDQFLPSLKALPVENIILIAHTMSEKDEITGTISEFPVGTSRNMGRNLPASFDDVWKQTNIGNKYTWNMGRSGMFIGAGSRLNLPSQIPATYEELKKHLK